MNLTIRDGKFDVVIAAGPRIESWPSAGVQILSRLCADLGLSVGQFGGDSLVVHGVIPLPGTGGLVIAEDAQKRIHRIRARAVVRISTESLLPDPFPGWRSPGLIPISTAEILHKESQLLWTHTTVILGTGNRGLRFGSILLDSGTSEVFCVESHPQWGAKRFAGWEVERRRFEMTGGKIIEAKPLQLSSISPLLWKLRLQDAQGVRVLDVGRVVSAGPFQNIYGVREYPPSSLLFEMDQTAPKHPSDNIEGWAFEEERSKWLAGKIIKALISDLGPQREALDEIFKKARARLKRYVRHRENPFTPSYQGKWLQPSDSKKIRTFGGMPQHSQKEHPVASVECFEDIPCQICQTVCPTSAIQVNHTSRNKNEILIESACTSCGICVASCPSGSIPLIHEKENQSLSQLTLPYRGSKPWKIGEFVTLANRRGETLGSARITGILEPQGAIIQGSRDSKPQLIQVDVPTYLTWEARSAKRTRSLETEDQTFLASIDRSSLATEKVEISLNGEKRLVRDHIPISIALFEIGQNRSNDALLCPDGGCGLCHVYVDGVEKKACQAQIHRGMTIRIPEAKTHDPDSKALCPCLNVTQEQILERLKQGKLRSPEAILSFTHVGEGKCHGQLCMNALKRLLQEQNLDTSQWIDWRFPWSDWVLPHTQSESKTFQF